MQTITIRCGDSFELLKSIPTGSIGAVVTDPPYGLEFMGKSWDKLWGDTSTTTGFSKPGIGDRTTPWPSFDNASSTNPTCHECGGRVRGENKCECEEPEWWFDGQLVGTGSPQTLVQTKRSDQARQMQQWHEGWLIEVIRCLRPGGTAKVFAASRTQHRLSAAMESVGFYLDPAHSVEAWAYGSGYPKNMNLSKVMTRLGIETEIIKQFDGFGSGLKPAFEPFIVGTKPMEANNASL